MPGKRKKIARPWAVVEHIPPAPAWFLITDRDVIGEPYWTKRGAIRAAQRYLAPKPEPRPTIVFDSRRVVDG